MLVLGVGNPILGDDGVGVAVAKELAKSEIAAAVDVKEAENIGLDILNTIDGYDMVIIVDAIVVKKEKVGKIIRIENPEHAITAHSTSLHDVNFASAIKAGRKLGIKIPKIVVYGINVEQEKMEEFREGLSPEVERAVKRAVKRVLKETRQLPPRPAKIPG